MNRAAFRDQSTDGVAVFGNIAESQIQGARICLVAEYDTPQNAQAAEVLLGFYREALAKGTTRFRNKTSLFRAFDGTGMDSPEMSVERYGTRVIWTIPMSVIPGNRLDHYVQGSELLEHMLDSPLAAEKEELFEAVREDVTRGIQDRIKDHTARAQRMFKATMFPNAYPFSDDNEIQIVQQASWDDLANAFSVHIEKAKPIVLYSGETPIEEVIGALSSLTGKYTRSSESIVPIQKNHLEVGERKHVDGPCETTHFLRAYPLLRDPSSVEEKAAVFLFSHVLGGGGIASMMMAELRMKLKLVYGANTHYQPHNNLVMVATEHDTKHFDTIVEQSAAVMQRAWNGELHGFPELKKQRLGLLIMRRAAGKLSQTAEAGYRLDKAMDVYVRETLDPFDKAYLAIASLSADDVTAQMRTFLDPTKSQIFTYGKR